MVTAIQEHAAAVASLCTCAAHMRRRGELGLAVLVLGLHQGKEAGLASAQLGQRDGVAHGRSAWWG